MRAYVFRIKVFPYRRARVRIVRNLAIFSGVVILLIGACAYAHAMPWSELIPLLLTSVLAAVPVLRCPRHSPLRQRLLEALYGRSAWCPYVVFPRKAAGIDE
jgi:H+-transporting ATPase